jgi:hypothetical protein
MPFQKLQFRPGVVRDVTAYTNEGGWRDSNLVRFRFGCPQSLGGWQRYSATSAFLGTCRSMLNWITLASANLLGFGTTYKYYIENGGTNYDITPIRRTVTLNGAFTASTGSSTVTVADASHGCVTGDFVTFSGAVSLGGNVTAAVLNSEYQITYINANSYSITVSVTANASDTGNGGASIVAKYQINTGLDTQVGGTGWGAGTWGRGTWGSATTISASNTLRLWSQDNYGEDLVINVRNAGVYYWYASTGVGTRAVSLASLSTDSQTPTIALQVIVSDRDRHIIALGANYGGVTAQDPLIIRFSSQEDPFTWTAVATNTAGDLRLGSGSSIIRGIETKREILVFTDVAVYSLQYVGPPYTFGIQQVGSGVNVGGYNCFATVDDTVFWMGQNSFFVYTGKVDPLPCPLNNYIFTDFNLEQSDKIFAGVNTEYSEIFWFYPSANSFENDRYVIYNYSEKVWVYGQLSRTAWIDRGVRAYPIAAGTDGRMYNHELGNDDGSTIPATPLNAYIESSPVDLGEGDKFSFIRRVLPDVGFVDSTDNPRLDIILKTQNYPGSNYVAGSDSVTQRTAVVPVEQFTEVENVRLRGRSVIFRIESNRVGTRWVLGSPRLEIQPDGRR